MHLIGAITLLALLGAGAPSQKLRVKEAWTYRPAEVSGLVAGKRGVYIISPRGLLETSSPTVSSVTLLDPESGAASAPPILINYHAGNYLWVSDQGHLFALMGYSPGIAFKLRFDLSSSAALVESAMHGFGRIEDGAILSSGAALHTVGKAVKYLDPAGKEVTLIYQVGRDLTYRSFGAGAFVVEGATVKAFTVADERPSLEVMEGISPEEAMSAVPLAEGRIVARNDDTIKVLSIKNPAKASVTAQTPHNFVRGALLVGSASDVVVYQPKENGCFVDRWRLSGDVSQLVPEEPRSFKQSLFALAADRLVFWDSSHDYVTVWGRGGATVDIPLGIPPSFVLAQGEMVIVGHKAGLGRAFRVN